MVESAWRTAVTSVAANEIRVRGVRIDEMMGTLSFGEAVWLILRGVPPPARVGSVIEAILVASIDHGVTPPSTLAVRNAASTGAPPICEKSSAPRKSSSPTARSSSAIAAGTS